MYTKLFVTLSIPSTIYAIDINDHLLFARQCVQDHTVRRHNSDIKKFALMKKICEQIQFCKVADTRESDPRAVGKYEKGLGPSTWGMREPSQRRLAETRRMSGILPGG